MSCRLGCTCCHFFSCSDCAITISPHPHSQCTMQAIDHLYRQSNLRAGRTCHSARLSAGWLVFDAARSRLFLCRLVLCLHHGMIRVTEFALPVGLFFSFSRLHILFYIYFFALLHAPALCDHAIDSWQCALRKTPRIFGRRRALLRPRVEASVRRGAQYYAAGSKTVYTLLILCVCVCVCGSVLSRVGIAHSFACNRLQRQYLAIDT
jgi:hypothetical protein